MDTHPPGPSGVPLLEARSLALGFGSRLVQERVSFAVAARTIFAIVGVSGCGKSTLLKCLIGLMAPASGQVLHGGTDYWAAGTVQRTTLRKGCGMLFQSAALWSSMTVAENIDLALKQLTTLDAHQRAARVAEVLGWVGLEKFATFLPAALSGGMKKHAALARAIAGSPPLLLLDEPSAGLDPISSRNLDQLILEIRQRTGAAVILVSHELPSLFALADDGIFLDADSKCPIGHGSPRQMFDDNANPTVHAFMRRESLPASGRVSAAPSARVLP